MTYQAQPSKSQFGHPQVHTNAAGIPERNGGETFAIKVAFDFTTADGAVLYTLPSDLRVRAVNLFWEITASFTGGSSSAIGVSSSQSAFATAGMLLGGSGGDVAATLVTGVQPFRGTQGTAFTAAPFIAVLDGGATLKFNRVASAFTAGAGFIHAEFRVVG
jgi:hypothetical protein